MTIDELIYRDLVDGFGESLAGYAAKRAVAVVMEATGLTREDLEGLMSGKPLEAGMSYQQIAAMLYPERKP